MEVVSVAAEYCDVVSFNIYRGLTADFVPSTPIATVSALTYNDAFASGEYYYKLEGVDKAGNKGVISRLLPPEHLPRPRRHPAPLRPRRHRLLHDAEPWRGVGHRLIGDLGSDLV